MVTSLLGRRVRYEGFYRGKSIQETMEIVGMFMAKMGAGYSVRVVLESRESVLYEQDLGDITLLREGEDE